ncbi:MAG: HAMP domain-containing sensor histidine kinase [Cyclobacteriaceae bacterium]
MKLLAITNRLYLISIGAVILISSLAAFFILRSIINNEFNRKLIAEKEQFLNEFRENPELKAGQFLNVGDRIMITPIRADSLIQDMMIDTAYYEPYEEEVLPFRVLTFTENINGTNYKITISKSLVPNMDLISGIGQIMIGMGCLILLVLVLINKVILRKLWAPFEYLLDHLKTFDITSPRRIRQGEYTFDSKVDEFKQLNQVLNDMIKQSIKDYNSLKEFTENTSHEIQTPLAIIRNKAETLLQEDLSKEQLEDIGKIYEAAGRLSRLKTGLSLISRIDNNQYIKKEPINLKEVIESKLEDFEELIAIKNLRLKTTYYGDPELELNSELTSILITNLINNAIKHNIKDGLINIVLKDVELLIENTGTPPVNPTEQMFDRFQKTGDTSESTGLGLSLVKKIVEYFNLKVKYIYEKDLHKLYLTFDHLSKKTAIK